MTIGRGRPKKAISHSTAPNEKNQNSSPAHNRCVTVARANTVKNVWVRTPQIGSRKTAIINFTHFVGTVSGSDAAMKLLGVARAKLRTTFRPRFELRVPRFFFDLRFVTAKVAADYADLHRRKQDRTADYQIARMNCRAGASPIVFGKFTAAGGLEGLRGERNFTCTLAAVVQRVGALWVQEPSAKSARSSCRAGA